MCAAKNDSQKKNLNLPRFLGSRSYFRQNKHKRKFMNNLNKAKSSLNIFELKFWGLESKTTTLNSFHSRFIQKIQKSNYNYQP
jgi:hypothetical protein